MGQANLFFIELIIVLLFFSFSSAVILRIFAAADHKQDMSDLTERAVICSQSIAEAFSVSGNIGETAALVFGNTAVPDESGELRLDKNMLLSESGTVTLRLAEKSSDTEAGRLSRLSAAFIIDGKELYSLECSSYKPFGEDSGNE